MITATNDTPGPAYYEPPDLDDEDEDGRPAPMTRDDYEEWEAEHAD